jgi:hypothetical protein
VDGYCRFVQIGIGHDNDRVLTAHFAGHLGATLGGFNVQRAADFVRSGE